MTSPGRVLALHALRSWRAGTDFADTIMHRLLLKNALGESDRKFAQELFYGVLRNLTRLDFYIHQLRRAQIDTFSRDVLRLGLYQLFLLQMQEHAAVYETVELVSGKQRSLINGVLRNAVRHRAKLELAATNAPLSVSASHPEWLLSRWQQRFGEETAVSLARWNNEPPPVYARVNTLRIAVSEFAKKYPELRLVSDHALFFECEELPSEAILNGHCYIQDRSTALAVELLQPKTSDAILDACAAPGGKTTYIAALTENRARITACDRNAERIDLLKNNLTSLGAANVAVIQHDWPEGEPGPGQFDKILLDAPCTNTGVMRRRADLRWRLRPEDFARMHKKQIAIARAVVPLLKTRGAFVYSTCSLEREENEDVVKQLATEFPHLKLDKIESVLPFRDGFDGAFAARFISS